MFVWQYVRGEPYIIVCVLLLGEEGLHHSMHHNKGYIVSKDPTLVLPVGLVKFEALVVDCMSPLEAAVYRMPTTTLQSEQSGQCAICLEDLTPASRGVALDGCSPGHCFHESCAASMLQRRPQCPVCRRWFAHFWGEMPCGRMVTWEAPKVRLPGNEQVGTIVINYHLLHDGKWHFRECYLPDNKQGVLASRLLQVAFERRLTFGLGTSATTGQQHH